MKICIVTKNYPNLHETQVNNHIARLFDGNSCVICQALMDDDADDKISVLSLDRIPETPITGVLKRFLHSLDAFAGLQKRHLFGAKKRVVRAFLKREKVDVILCEFGSVGTTVGRGLLDLGIPVYCYFRGQDASEKLRSRRQVNSYLRFLPGFAGVFAVSGVLVRNLAECGIRHPNTHVIPSGVNTDRFRPAEKRAKSFVCVGRLIEKKRPDITVRAFCEVTRHDDEARLTIIGDGPLRELCEQIAREGGCADRVRFMGEQPHDVVAEEMARSEVFLQHSVVSAEGDTEGAPTAIQEAMACGCAVVSTIHAGIPDIVVEGRTGFLVAEFDEPAYRERMAILLADRDMVAKMAVESRALAVENYDSRKLYKKLEAIIGGPGRA